MNHDFKFALSLMGIGTFVTCALFVVGIGMTKFNLWSSALKGEAKLRKAEWTRKIQVREAQGKLDASSMLAKAEIERAKGVAEANKIIGDSLKGNEGYLRYLWIDSLQHTQDKVIYVPTEAGLPILEANRLRTQG